MKFNFLLVTSILANCAKFPEQHVVKPIDTYIWNSQADGVESSLRFIEKPPFYSLENGTFIFSDVEVIQNFCKLNDYGCFFKNPKPNGFKILGTGLNKIIVISGGDGGSAFDVSVHIKNGRIEKWGLTGTDIKDSPVSFDWCAPES